MEETRTINVFIASPGRLAVERHLGATQSHNVSHVKT